MNGYGRCPRCGYMTMEHLRTHSHCWECGYFPEESPRLHIKKQLEAEAFSGRNFAENEANYKELFGEVEERSKMNEHELERYFKDLETNQKGDEVL